MERSRGVLRRVPAPLGTPKPLVSAHADDLEGVVAARDPVAGFQFDGDSHPKLSNNPTGR